ncbi:MAG: hypothetical protein MJ078_01395, partial [Clostridia bacterium]|nr:hypothetical protein [Clostridia bacterium]
KDLIPWTEERSEYRFKEEAYDYSSCRVDYFRRPDVKQAALFPQNVRLTGDYSVSFADGYTEYRLPLCYASFLAGEYPEAKLPPLALMNIGALDRCVVRNLLWSSPDSPYGEKMKEETVIYAESQWFIRKTSLYALAAKAGNNREEHNHNDVGSFMLTTSEGVVLWDLGGGEYTRFYFDPAYRYTILCNRSSGHGVPLVNGKEQVVTDAKAPVQYTENTFTLRLDQAYDDPAFVLGERAFLCGDTSVTVKDTFGFTETPVSLTDRFVVKDKPVLTEEGRVGLRKGSLSYDKDALSVSVKEDAYSNHQGVSETVYFIDFTPKKPAKQMSFTYTVSLK